MLFVLQFGGECLSTLTLQQTTYTYQPITELKFESKLTFVSRRSLWSRTAPCNTPRAYSLGHPLIIYSTHVRLYDTVQVHLLFVYPPQHFDSFHPPIHVMQLSSIQGVPAKGPASTIRWAPVESPWHRPNRASASCTLEYHHCCRPLAGPTTTGAPVIAHGKRS